ncbi:carboxymuconolactone decarboxylase family protein [Enterococcus raffinosus]|uniref:Carboxymuconolactone decarboxylase family protein n=1 Tax=Enterococcus raffinosus TaxID=71452 RepID=A0AAW8T6W3_9ENTE|nr:carboxymuconolactone decarboxylase family protein [Enterococcus raffinosus]MDT2523298.1 carboxymuconolactone decarboxylase family protein [Enterococcus raffinosus]MDT2529283.1 carboxymuconolactone decarboxylase family protein [Enterococcus raffinosus]MDT2534137.1 carboxymuconolactone decarboxylase family protein [Enterococcus raffinosus]MDT2543449.1 carboxymuconolactone decarboxylase family protein [Enterococcus raffinosus]MDT2555173.1 carboxymuconolactone decarboxylase family protein [Ente
MYDKRLKQGMKNLKAIDGEAGERVIQTLEGIAPDVGRYILAFAFGDIYEKDTLSFREREIITITSLLTQGDTKNQLIVHINGSLNVGITKEEIIEVFTHCIPYVGFPKVLNAIMIAKEVFETRKL